MRSLCRAAIAALSTLVLASTVLQCAEGLSLTDYQVVSQQGAAGNRAYVTLRADLVNTGDALGAVTATVNSLDPFSMRTLPGQDTLQFPFVPANGHITSSNTVTLLVDSSLPFDSSKLQWVFHTDSQTPIANPGPDQGARVGTLVILNGGGSIGVSGGGALSYSWSFESRPPGTSAKLMDSSSAIASFMPDVPGAYVFRLTVANGGVSSSATVTIVATTSVAAPMANAGPNQTVTPNGIVQLKGSGSDPQNLPLTFEWSLVAKPSGSAAILSSGTAQNPTFIADLPGSYVAQLIVSNGTLSSAPSTVSVSAGCLAPVANAGPNQTVTVGASVTLNGGGSSGACNGLFSYSWSLNARPDGSGAALSAPNIVSPSFIADVAGVYMVQLTVNNGQNSSPSTVAITATSGSGLTIPDGITIGQYLQVRGSVSIGNPAPAGGVDVLLKVNKFNDLGLVDGGPRQLLISPAATAVGSDFITMNVPAGASSAPFYLQSLDGVGRITYTATAPGFNSVTGVVNFAPSAIVISGPRGLGFSGPLTASLSAGGSIPITIYAAQLDTSSYNVVAAQELAAGYSVTVPLSNGNSSIGLVTTPVTIDGGSDRTLAVFVPQSIGETTITVLRTPMFVRAGNNGSVTVNVTP